MFSTSIAHSTYFICNISMKVVPKINAMHQTPTLGGAIGGALGWCLDRPTSEDVWQTLWALSLSGMTIETSVE